MLGLTEEYVETERTEEQFFLEQKQEPVQQAQLTNDTES